MAVPFANDGSFMQQFMAQQQQQQQQHHQQPSAFNMQAAAATSQDMSLMPGGSVAMLQFDMHNSSPQLIFSDGCSVANRRSMPLDPTASKFCFAALVPVVERQGRFALRLEAGVPIVSTGTGSFRTQEGVFLGVGIARRSRFGAEGFGRGDESWGLSNRRMDDYSAVFSSGGGIAEKRMPMLRVGDVVSLHWDLDVGAVVMRINGLLESQHVFKVPSGSPDQYVAGVSLADEHTVRLVEPPEMHLAVRICAGEELARLERRRDRGERSRDRDSYERDRHHDGDGRNERERGRAAENRLWDRPPAAPAAAATSALSTMTMMPAQQQQQLQQIQNLQRVAMGLPPLPLLPFQPLPPGVPGASAPALPGAQQQQQPQPPPALPLQHQPSRSLTEMLKADPSQLPWNKSKAPPVCALKPRFRALVPKLRWCPRNLKSDSSV